MGDCRLVWLPDQLENNGLNGLREIGCGRGAAILIVHDVQRLLFASLMEYRLDEIPAVRADDPGRPQDDVARILHSPNRIFARRLALAVDVDGANRVEWPIGVGHDRAIKDVVGRQMQKGDTCLARRGREQGRTVRVDAPSAGRVGFCVLDGCVGGAVDDARPHALFE